MELCIWIGIGLLSLCGLIAVFHGLRQCKMGGSTRKYIHETEVITHTESMERKIENFRALVRTLQEKKARLKSTIESGDSSLDPDELYWQIYDLDWRIDDLNWSIDDIRWDIRDAKFELDWRKEQEKNNVATFWTVLGAAVFGLAGLILSIYQYSC